MGLSIKDYTFVPLAWLTEPHDGRSDVLINRWWITQSGSELAFYKGQSPQCNANEAIVRKLAARCDWPAEVVLVPMVFLAVRTFDVVEDGEYQGHVWEYQLPTSAP